MHKENQSIGVSFDLPDWPSMGQIEDYQEALSEALTSLKDMLTNARINAIAHVAAFESGLASNWQCERMPNPLPENIRDADGLAINYSGALIREQVRTWTEIPLV